MSKEELLNTTFDSAPDAMYALEEFLKEVDESYKNETRGSYMNLRAFGNRIFE